MMLRLKQLIVASSFGESAMNVAELGKRLLADVRSPQLRDFYHDEIDRREAMTRLIRKDFVCIDIGCHIGSVLKRMMSLAPAGVHIGVEPAPEKAASLRRHFPSATIYECALAEASSEAVFFEDLKNSGYSSLHARAVNSAKVSSYSVRVETLDAIASGLPRVDFIKIDVERAELSVVKGGRATIDRFRPLIVFECGPVQNNASQEDVGDAIFEVLVEQHGYRLFVAGDLLAGGSPLSREQFRSARTFPFRALNFFAMPNDDEVKRARTRTR